MTLPLSSGMDISRGQRPRVGSTQHHIECGMSNMYTSYVRTVRSIGTLYGVVIEATT